jgi:hypothetical protein
MLTHSPRPDNEGGAKEVMFAAINALDEAHRSGDPGAIEAALSNVRSAVAEFADIAIDVWARAMSDPKNPFFFKRESLGVTADGRSVNTNGIAQELARLGWTNMFGAEADSIQRFLIRYSMTFSPDFTDAAFQSVWGTILSVAVDWDMPVPLISRPGGDMVVVIPPKDLNGVDVDPAGFVFEVWSRVMSRYGDKPYPDVKKVMFNESEIVLGGGFDETAAREAFVSVADSMGLQAVPFMLHDKDDRYVLFTPEVNGWKDGEKVGVDAVVGALRAAGMPISSLRKSGRTVLKRVDIYESADGDGVRYRFSPFELGGGWSPFQKILSISTVLGTIPLMKNRGDVARYQRVIDEMGMPDGDIDNLKKRFFPRKAGFGAHASAALNCETADRECVAGIASLGSLVGFLDAGPIADIERAIGGPFPDDHARAVSRLSDLAAIYGRSAARQLAMAATRIAASNVALEKRIEDAGEALDGNAVGALMMMRDARREAAKHIGNISSGMRIIANTSMEYAVRGSAVDISPATIATSFVTQNIGFLRALMTGAGSGMFGQIALSPVRVTPIT